MNEMCFNANIFLTMNEMNFEPGKFKLEICTKNMAPMDSTVRNQAISKLIFYLSYPII